MKIRDAINENNETLTSGSANELFYNANPTSIISNSKVSIFSEQHLASMYLPTYLQMQTKKTRNRN